MKKANDDYMAKVIEYIKKPIEIDADLMIQKATTGLQNALRDEIYPEVKLCLSFLLCMRSNDLNVKSQKKNGTVPKLGLTFSLLEDHPGTFSMVPSTPPTPIYRQKCKGCFGSKKPFR